METPIHGAVFRAYMHAIRKLPGGQASWQSSSEMAIGSMRMGSTVEAQSGMIRKIHAGTVLQGSDMPYIEVSRWI